MSKGAFERGDAVRVVAGPQRGRACVVVRVTKTPRVPASAAQVLVKFEDGAYYHVAANLEPTQAGVDAGTDSKRKWCGPRRDAQRTFAGVKKCRKK